MIETEKKGKKRICCTTNLGKPTCDTDMEEVAEKKEEDVKVKEETVEQRRMTKRLRDAISVKVEGRSTKVNLNPFKLKFLSLKN